jgi:hypothetical protein
MTADSARSNSRQTTPGIAPRRGPAAFMVLLALAAAIAPARAAGSNDPPASSPRPTAVLVSTAVEPVWPNPSELRGLSAIGAHAAIVFSPDFSVPTNRFFWEGLGFLYVEDASWERALDAIERHNAESPDHAVETVFVTSHGANGNGLKLQTGHDPADPRSYVSIGVLQERLGRAGVRRVVIAACNTSRLFRPDVYNRLDRTVRDKLFLPATLGYVEASDGFDPAGSTVTVVRRADNQKENTTEGSVAELSPAARRALGLDDAAARRTRFVVSDLFVQMLTADPKLRLTSGGYVSHVVMEGADNARSDRMFRAFVKVLDSVATRQ